MIIIGSAADDVLIGSNDRDEIFGLAGNDILIGGNDADSLAGGDGNDYYEIDHYGDVVVELVNEGIDTIHLAFRVLGNYTMPNNIERLIYDMKAAQPIWIFGNDLANEIILDGVGDIAFGEGGDDTITGGSGNDVMLGDVGNDTLSGSLGDDILEGGAGDDFIDGGAGDDVIDGESGIDVMQGGYGDDTYYVENASDQVLENAGEGTDTVVSSVSFYLASNFENLTLASGAGNLTASGNAANNTLQGNEGNNILLGQDGDDALVGGAGNDILAGGNGNDSLDGGTGANELIGGPGNDLYAVRANTTLEAVLHTVYEAPGEGTDEVWITAPVFALEWYGSSELENLTLIDLADHAAAIGNALDNVITGNSGADGLYGRAGNDTLVGGQGNANTLVGNEGDDNYVIAAAGDSVIEFADQGRDTVFTALGSFTLPANVENLTYFGNYTFTGIGSADGNRISGGGGDDFLSGLDGNDELVGTSGADVLLGGNGADQFVYRAGEPGLDRILDFTPGSDRIVLNNFAHTANFSLVQSAAPVATTSDSTFLYNPSNGIVSFDADGSGSDAAIALAQLNGGLSLTLADFLFDGTLQPAAVDPGTTVGIAQLGGHASITDVTTSGTDAGTGGYSLFANIENLTMPVSDVTPIYTADSGPAFIEASILSGNTAETLLEVQSDATGLDPAGMSHGAWDTAQADEVQLLGVTGLTPHSTGFLLVDHVA